MLLNLKIVVFLCNIILKLLAFSNLARNKKAIQSSTDYDVSYRLATFAVDSTLSVSDCSQTSNLIGHKSWLAVDLEQIFKVTQVCLLNKQSGKKLRIQILCNFIKLYCLYTARHLADIQIILGLKRIENGIICKTINGPIKTSASTASSEYSCYTCSTPIIGSFLFIKNIYEDKKLAICDIKVEGTLVQSRGFKIEFFCIYIFFT